MTEPTAWITTSPAAPRPTGAPYAVWIESREELDHPGARAAAIVVCADRELVERGTQRVVAVGEPLGVADVPPLTPFVRARYRRARGLPDELIVAADDDGLWRLPDRTPIDRALLGTTLAMASVAVASERALTTALAWGTPCVTDLTGAAAIGALDGVHVVVTTSLAAAYPDATALAADARRAAAVGRAGRWLVEYALDATAPAQRVVQALQLYGRSPRQRIEAALDDLHTPPAARIRSRARDAVAV